MSGSVYGSINYSRVRRIKSVIYALTFLAFLVPAILLVALGVRMIGHLGPAGGRAGQQPSPQISAPGIGQMGATRQSEQLHGASLAPSPEGYQFPMPPGTVQTELYRPRQGDVQSDALQQSDAAYLQGQTDQPSPPQDTPHFSPPMQGDQPGGDETSPGETENAPAPHGFLGTGVPIPNTGLPRLNE